MKTSLLGLALLFVGSAAISVGCMAGQSSEAAAAGVGDACVPLPERDTTFRGFDEKEVSLETNSPSCTTGVCLINHFRGRVSCPYGQSADGAGPGGGQPCKTPTQNAAVTGDANDPVKKALVSPQCVDRSAEKSVYCSCRCANINGKTDDGAAYCACPSGFECTSAVTSIGGSSNDVAGSYCIKRGTVYSPDTACNQGDCDPVGKTCGS